MTQKILFIVPLLSLEVGFVSSSGKALAYLIMPHHNGNQ